MNSNQIKLQIDYNCSSCIVKNSTITENIDTLKSIGLSIDTINNMNSLGILFDQQIDWNYGQPRTDLTPAYFKAYNQLRELVVEQIYKEIGDKFEIENKLHKFNIAE